MILNRDHIRQLLNQKFGYVKEAGKEMLVKCPFCASRHARLSVNLDKYNGVYKCWRCGESGSIQKLLGKKFKLKQEQVRQVSQIAETNEVPSPGDLVPITQVDADNNAVTYLTQARERTFDLETLDKVYGVKYCSRGRLFACGKGCKYNTANSLIFPVWMNGEIKGWQSRLVYDPLALPDEVGLSIGWQKDDEGRVLRPPKYMTNPGLKKSQILYNFDQARNYNYVVVTEGVFDVFAVGPMAVATFGTGITEAQAVLLRTYWDHVIILLDAGTEEASSKLKAMIGNSVRVTNVPWTDAKDAGDTDTDEIWRRITAYMEHEQQFTEMLVKGG